MLANITTKQSKDCFESNKREREREQLKLNSSLNSANAKNLGNSNATDSIDSIHFYSHNTNKSHIALCKSGGLK